MKRSLLNDEGGDYFSPFSLPLPALFLFLVFLFFSPSPPLPLCRSLSLSPLPPAQPGGEVVEDEFGLVAGGSPAVADVLVQLDV